MHLHHRQHHWRATALEAGWHLLLLRLTPGLTTGAHAESLPSPCKGSPQILPFAADASSLKWLCKAKPTVQPGQPVKAAARQGPSLLLIRIAPAGRSLATSPPTHPHSPPEGQSLSRCEPTHPPTHRHPHPPTHPPHGSSATHARSVPRQIWHCRSSSVVASAVAYVDVVLRDRLKAAEPRLQGRVGGWAGGRTGRLVQGRDGDGGQVGMQWEQCRR